MRQKLMLALLALFVGAGVAGANQTTEPSPEIKVLINANYGKIPLSFEANASQTNKKVKFLSRGQGYGLYLTPTEAVMILSGGGTLQRAPTGATNANSLPLAKGDRGGLASVLRMSLANANRHPKLVGEEEQISKSNYFVGKNPKKWRTDIANYGKVRYEEVYKGIDLVYYGNQRKLEYDFIVQPGADYKKIRMRFKGADKVSIDDNGNLVLHTKNGDVVQHKPVVYQTEPDINRQNAENVKGNDFLPLRKGGRGDLPEQSTPTGKYVILADAGGAVCLECGDASPPLQSADKSAHSKTKTGAASGAPTGALVGFEVENYDPAKTLVIDPVLSYSTYLGGNGSNEQGNAIAVDSSGNAYITGNTNSTNYPTTSGVYQTANVGGNDVFVTKLNSTGTALVYSTYLGGSNNDFGQGIVVDSSGNAYITGNTNSTNYPTTSGAYQTTHNGGDSAFVTKLNSTGTALIYSTYLGATNQSFFGIAVDSSGNAYITGSTTSSSFPTTVGAYQTTYRGGNGDAFVTKLNSTGTALVYSTYLGGTNQDNPYGIAVDSSGNAYITGSSTSTTFPTTSGAYQTANGGDWDAFVTKLNSTGTALIYSTYIGGSNADYSLAIAVDSSGNAYVTGYTWSTNFPATAGAYKTTFGGQNDVFVAKLNSTGTALIYSTDIGNNSNGWGIAIDSSGNAYVIGETSATNFPITAGAYQATLGGSSDAFMTKLNSTGTALSYSTYLGGSGYDRGNGITMDSSGNAYITGNTGSTNFPTTSGAYQTTYGGGNSDAFVTKLSLDAVTPTSTTTTITSSQNPSTSGAAVTFTATVSGSGGTPTGTVTFMDGSTTLGTGTLSSGQATYSTSSLSTGTHSITAVYGGDSAFAASTSSVLTQTVTAVNTTTTTTTTVTSSQNPSTSGESVTFTATVTSGSTTPTGTVTFKDGSTTLSTGTLSGGQATYTTSSLSVGSHSITAVYGGSSVFATSTSSVLTQTVATAISEDYTGTYYGHGVTIHLQQTSRTLTGRFYIGNSSNGGNIGGIVDSAGRAYAWAWWDNTELGSGAIAGRLTISGSQGTFSFGGGRNTSGRIDEVLLSDMTKSPLAGSATITTGTSTANYAGTYTMTGLSITLTQSGSILSGTFTSGGLTGNVGGFVDSSGRAYIWAYWDSLFTGFGVMAGNLTVSGSQTTFNFGGGRGSDGRINEIILSGMAREGR